MPLDHRQSALAGLANALLRRRSAVFVLVCTLLVLVPATLVLAATNFRYGSSSFTPGGVGAETPGYAFRNYNRAYHDERDQWRVRYYDTAGNITWQVISYESPTSQGNTTGARLATCYNLTQYFYGQPWNCDTTRP